MATQPTAAPDAYPRDLAGYRGKPPNANWPGNARVAVQCVINFEEGGERCLLHGDDESESFLSEIVGAQPFANRRHINMESIYDYGARAGFWRLREMFVARGIPVTVFGVAMALQRCPDAVAAMQESKWEIASHGWRWLDYAFTPEAEERRHLQLAIKTHAQVTGEKPRGWYIGRCGENTRRLLLQEGEWLYDSDSYADDLPYWLRRADNKPHLIIPYTLDANDMRFATAQGFNCGEQFYQYLKDTFDVLYAEGEKTPKMMSIGLHCRLAGRPGRANAVARFLDYAASKEKTWFPRRADIAQHWHKHHYPDAQQLAALPLAD